MVELENKIDYLKRTLRKGKIILGQYLPEQEFTIAISGNEIKYALPTLSLSPKDGEFVKLR